MTVFAPGRSDDELHEAIAAHQREAVAAHAVLLADIGEHDRVEAWRRMGARSEEDYLVRHHQLAWPTAKDWVRQARVLARHPEVAQSCAAGAMSLDKLNAACRLAAAQDEAAIAPAGPFDDPSSDDRARPAPPEPSAPDPSTPDGAAPDGSGPDPSAPDPSRPDGAAPDADAPATGTATSAAALLALIDEMSADQLARMARKARLASAAEADARHRRRHCSAVRDVEKHRLSILETELFDDDAATVWAAFLDYAANVKPDPETGAYPSLKARYADALVAMATAYLAAREKVTHHPMVIFHADARVLAGEEGWAETTDYSVLAAETVRRLACACRVDLMVDDVSGNPLKLGRAVREANWQQNEVCRRRDGGCRFCGSQLFLHAHHLKWWERDFGRTDDTNLVMLCSTCHHLVHEGGWVAEGDPYGEMRFISPRGTVFARRPHPQHKPGRRAGARPSPPPRDPARPPGDPQTPPTSQTPDTPPAATVSPVSPAQRGRGRRGTEPRPPKSSRGSGPADFAGTPRQPTRGAGRHTGGAAATPHATRGSDRVDRTDAEAADSAGGAAATPPPARRSTRRGRGSSTPPSLW